MLLSDNKPGKRDSAASNATRGPSAHGTACSSQQPDGAARSDSVNSGTVAVPGGYARRSLALRAAVSALPKHSCAEDSSAHGTHTSGERDLPDSVPDAAPFEPSQRDTGVVSQCYVHPAQADQQPRQLYCASALSGGAAQGTRLAGGGDSATPRRLPGHLCPGLSTQSPLMRRASGVPTSAGGLTAQDQRSSGLGKVRY